MNWITLEEVAEIESKNAGREIPIKWFYQEQKKGKLKVKKIGRRLCTTIEWLEEWRTSPSR